MIRDDFLWTEKYRPKTIADCILPQNIKAVFQQFVDQKNIPNLLLFGSAGTGKTSVAKALLNQLGCDFIIINGSLNLNIDALRNQIQTFASSVSFSGGRKYVIIDEADGLGHHIQSALRSFMEEFAKNCGFIFTCNFKAKIIEALHSRCSVIDFKILKKDRPELAKKFLSRLEEILNIENVSYEKKTLVELIVKYIPDWRRLLNELQRFSASGSIDSAIFLNIAGDSSIQQLVSLLKEKKFSEMRKWVAENSDLEPATIFHDLYNIANNVVDPSSLPQLVLILGDYSYKSAFVVDQEINLAACFTEIMADVTFI